MFLETFKPKRIVDYTCTMSRAWKPQVSDDLALDIWLMYNVPSGQTNAKTILFSGLYIYIFFFIINNLIAKASGLNLGKKLSNLISKCEALN